jgi:multidrug resistance efflux pump
LAEDRPARWLRALAPAEAEPSDQSRDRSPDALWEALVSAPTSEAFAPAYLELQCGLIEGTRQAVLLLGPPERGPFAVAAVWPEGKPPTKRLLEGAENAIARRKGLVAAALVEASDSGAPLPTSLVAHPIELAGKLHGAIVLEVEARAAPELRGILSRLRFGTGWVDSLARRVGGRIGMSRRARVDVVPNLLAATLEHDGFRGAATAFVTELATDLGCDRVSLGFLKGRRAQVRSISHSSHHGQNTNLIRAIEAAMEEAIDQQSTVVHPSPEGTHAAAAHAHSELALRHGSAAVCTVPLVYAGRLCGAVTLERSEDRGFDARTVQVCEVAASLVGPLLEVLRRDDRWIGQKAWEALRARLEDLLGPRHVALKLAAGSAALLFLFLLLVRGDYRVTADTVLEPMVLRAAVAPFDGYVSRAPARAGDLVRAGDLLAALDARDLELERVKWTSQREQLQKQYRQALAERHAPDVEIYSASLDEARAELDRIGEQLSKTELRAPFDGVVISGDLSQHLGAPVERGQLLFEVAPLDAYRVILEVDESDIAEIRPEQAGHIVFASLPDESYPFRVEKLTPVANAEEGRNYFRVEASLTGAASRLRPAIEGVAKIEIDRRSLVWIWTHDALDWLRLALWRWLP